jgi:hypothetical protein
MKCAQLKTKTKSVILLAFCTILMTATEKSIFCSERMQVQNINPENKIHRLLNICVYLIQNSSEESNKPFSYFIDEIKKIVVEFMGYFVQKYGQPKVNQFMHDLDSIRNSKKLSDIKKIINRYEEFSSVEVKRANILALANGLNRRLKNVKN